MSDYWHIVNTSPVGTLRRVAIGTSAGVVLAHATILLPLRREQEGPGPHCFRQATVSVCCFGLPLSGAPAAT